MTGMAIDPLPVAANDHAQPRRAKEATVAVSAARTTSPLSADQSPSLTGSGVATVVETIRQRDNSVEDTGEYLDDVRVAHVEECVRYYVD
jgi:hypothetical protein